MLSRAEVNLGYVLEVESMELCNAGEKYQERGTVL
jgi:hypothetical protein